VLLRLVRTPDAVWVDFGGVSALRIPVSIDSAADTGREAGYLGFATVHSAGLFRQNTTYPVSGGLGADEAHITGFFWQNRAYGAPVSMLGAYEGALA
jgi:hypothetical protein